MDEQYDDDDYYLNQNLLEHVQTVGQLIEKLQKFDQSLPILTTYEGWIRPGEYFSFNPHLSNLNKRDTSGDPEFYGTQECVVLK